jgi:hypothetical protein
MNDLLYSEKQPFRQTRMRVLTAIPPAGMTLLAIWQIGLGHPFGKMALSNGTLLGWTFFLWLIYVRLLTVTLVTEVRRGELRVGLRGLWRLNRVILTGVQSVRVVTFDPARDWGGYGMRTTQQGKAFIAGGNSGVELKLADSSIVLVGSQHASRLAAAISSEVRRTA